MEIESIERVALEQFAEKAYLDYSMYVILDRALPHIADGLKPVQRRIIYAMSELGLSAAASYKKSARTVGDVLGKFHPHGDAACYEAMVLMAQPFSYRYPFVDGQGNWGSVDDPKSFAAMRYTEAKLSSYAKVLLEESDQGTVEWVPNFDGSLKEPKLLPAQLPNILLNGVTGIAVGMSTDIPPHNLNEVAQACIYLLENPKAGIDDLFQWIQGPDLPTGAELITSRETLIENYKKGQGTYRVRAVYHVEEAEIVITALPYQVSGAKILEQIAGLMHAKKLPLVSDLRDESDHENPVRLVVVPRSSRVDSDALMSHLFAVTDLERHYRMNMNVIGMNGRPQVKDLLTLLQEWLSYRLETVRRRLQFRLEQVDDRLHLLAGLLTVFDFLDEVIRILRDEEAPKQVLMQQFQLSDRQVDALLSMRLRQLAKLEEKKLREEQLELMKEKVQLEATLGSERRMKTRVRKELESVASVYADERKTQLVERMAALELKETELLPFEAVTVVLSKNGWVRSARGHQVDGTTLAYKAGDQFLGQAEGKSNQSVVFFNQSGRAYTLSAHLLPSARGHGDPLTKWFKGGDMGVLSSLLIPPSSEKKYLLMNDMGYGFIVLAEALYSKNKTGKAIMNVPDGARLYPPVPVPDEEGQSILAAFLSSEGRLLIFDAEHITQLNKGRGVKLMNLSEGERLLSGICYCAGDDFDVWTAKRHMKLTEKEAEAYQGARARRGRKLPRGYQQAHVLQVAQKKSMDA